jgi:hypothetical protein
MSCHVKAGADRLRILRGNAWQKNNREQSASTPLSFIPVGNENILRDINKREKRKSRIPRHTVGVVAQARKQASANGRLHARHDKRHEWSLARVIAHATLLEGVECCV